MFFWSAFPFVRITVALALGIIASVFLPQYQVEVLGLCLFSILFFIGSSFINKQWFLKANWVFGLILVVLSFSLGYLRLAFENREGRNVNFSKNIHIAAYRAQVITQPIQKGKYFRSTVKISSILDVSWKPTSYKINLYTKSHERPFEYGDEILVKGTPQQVKGPQNPEEFNYKRYLTFLTIYQQHFIDTSKVNVLSSDNGNMLIAKSLHLRNMFSALLEKHIKEPNELAIAKALLLGNKDELDDEIKNVYAASGAMHVLAVSGLHVGIIYFVILYLLRIVPKEYRKEWLIAVVAIPLLWSYAFITGLSPSVLRAVTLFSVMAIGKSMNRHASMVNMLGVSAFILLVFNPYLLMQVGFQLSYIAVLGIIFIYPQVRKLLMPSNRVWVFFWDVTSISIAAQLATFPLSILYFHRFPTYFFVSNLVVIPAATLIVWLGVVFFAFSWVDLIASGVGTLLAYIIRFINKVLVFIHQLPGSDFNNIYLDVPQTWTLYLLITFLFLFVIYKYKTWAQMARICIVLFSLMVGNRWVQNNQLKQIAVYNIPYHLSLDCTQSGETVSIMDSKLVNRTDKIRFHVNPNRLLRGVDTYADTLSHAWKQLSFGKALVWNNTSILVLEEKVKRDDFPFDIILSELSAEKTVIKHKKYDLGNRGAFVIDIE